MKRITLLIIGILMIPFFSYSGGIVTNQNQSAAYIRMFARDASTGIDAVFFNPAGLTKLSDGFHLSLNNQYILQNKYVTSHYPYLNNYPVEYKGEVSVPLFPGIYGAYKKGNFTLSLGINPVGGGGSATFNNGLPSFEVPVSNLVPTLSAQGQPVSDYGLNAYFEGSSVYWGYQFGASYAFNDMFSAYLGIRYVSAKNTYNGYLKDITITLGGTETPAVDYFSTTVENLQPLNDGLYSLYDNNLGSYTLDQAYAASIIDEATYTQLSGGLTLVGLDPSEVTIEQGYNAVNQSYNGARRATYVL